MTRHGDRLWLRAGALLALAAALALAGCGRKGPLDPPPSAMVAPPPQTEPSLGENYDPNAPGFRRAPQTAAAPNAPPAPPDKRTFVLDPLIR